MPPHTPRNAPCAAPRRVRELGTALHTATHCLALPALTRCNFLNHPPHGFILSQTPRYPSQTSRIPHTYPTRTPHPLPPPSADLWICLICGHVGCGRYRGSHAAEHWQACGHGYALELETQVGWVGGGVVGGWWSCVQRVDSEGGYGGTGTRLSWRRRWGGVGGWEVRWGVSGGVWRGCLRLC